MKRTPELRLLIDLLGSIAKDSSGAIASPADDIDWRSFFALAQRHRVTGAATTVLTKAIDSGDIAAPPPDIIAHINARRREAMLAGLAILGELKTVLEAFEDHNIRPVLLKGLDVSQEAYGEIGMRSNRDIDLLVSAADMPSAQAALRKLGFERTEPSPALTDAELGTWRKTRKDLVFAHTARRTIVELHWRLFDNPTLMSFNPGDGCAATLFDQIDCAVLPRDFNFSYLCLHGSHHAWSRLKWLTDINALLALSTNELTASRFFASQGTPEGAAMAQALSLCRRVFSRPLPQKVEAELDRNFNTRLLAAIAGTTMTRAGAREIEDIPFGSTLKNISHYFLSADPRYLGAELADDFAEKFGPKALRKHTPARPDDVSAKKRRSLY